MHVRLFNTIPFIKKRGKQTTKGNELRKLYQRRYKVAKKNRQWNTISWFVKLKFYHPVSTGHYNFLFTQEPRRFLKSKVCKFLSWSEEVCQNFWLVWFHVYEDSCENLNLASFCTVCAVKSWSQGTRLRKVGVSYMTRTENNIHFKLYRDYSSAST